MKNLILASMIAFATAASVSVPAEAASVIIKTDHGGMHMRRHHRQRCHLKTVKQWRNHHLVVRRIRVCN